jgi:hypothetical protein
MNLIDLNREGGIGANSLFLQIGDVRVLVDSGLHPKLAGRKAAPDLGKLRGQSPTSSSSPTATSTTSVASRWHCGKTRTRWSS